MENIKALEKFGLSEKESKIYLSCLELGESTANDISLKSNLPRTLTYDILERVINLGLITYSIKDNKKYFIAENPKELLRIIKEKEQAINSILPNLENLQKMKGAKRPKIKIYEGKEGMKTMMDDILRSKTDELISYGSSRSSYEIIPAFMDDWHKRRIKQKVTLKILYNNTKEARRKTKNSKSLQIARYKFMPIELESPTAILIYLNRVIFQSWTKDPFAVLIEDEQMAENQKRYFNELWKIGKK